MELPPCPHTRMDPLHVLPCEMSLHILGFLDAAGLVSAGQVCPRWRRILDAHDHVWARHCWAHCLGEYVKRDRQAGFTWKETLIRNYGSRALLRAWLSGKFTHGCTSLPARHMAAFDADAWGDIIDAQFARDMATVRS